MPELSQYGKILRHYKGKGLFFREESDKEPVECDFEVAQFSDGEILLDLQSNEYFREWGTSGINFQGSTQNGQILRANGPAILIRETNFTRRIYRLNADAKLKIGQSGAISEGEVRFAITNFAFIGTVPVKITPTHTRLARLTLSIDKLEINIDQLLDYEERLAELKASHGCDITSEIVVPLNQGSLDLAIKVASRICDLLSIARGKRINWLSYEVRNTAGDPVFIEHGLRITTPFAGYEVIDDMPPENTKNYIEECYLYCTQPSFQLDLNTIANISSDIHSRGFIDGRCLLIFSLLEHLFFRTSLKSQTQKRNTTPQNRVRELIKDHKISIADSEIKWYWKLRNSLVHELKFPTPDSRVEYLRLLHFFDQILLSLLGYTGYYINMTKLPLFSGEQADKMPEK